MEAASIICHQSDKPAIGRLDTENSLLTEFQLVDDVRVRYHGDYRWGFPFHNFLFFIGLVTSSAWDTPSEISRHERRLGNV